MTHKDTRSKLSVNKNLILDDVFHFYIDIYIYKAA